MKESYTDFYALIKEILNKEKPACSLSREMKALKAFFSQKAEYSSDQGFSKSANMQLPSGLALSPAFAVRCLDDVARSVIFIRAVHQAIRDRIALQKERPIQVLYAGCGPFAPLVVAQMAIFSPDEVVFSLMDIHQESLHTAMRLIRRLQFENFVAEYIHSDATVYRVPVGTEPDIILSETMNAALSKEPQVEVFRNLAVQAPEACLIPSRVTVSVALMKTRRECIRDMGSVFELSRQTINIWPKNNPDQLPASTVIVPAAVPEHSKVFLRTKINVYKSHMLSDSESEITIPQRLPVKRGTVRGGEMLRFSYRLGTRPGLECEVI